ncbi:MAG: DNA polymerase III subunit alpha [bacterium]
MAISKFVHLHNHTEYSLLDGACRVSDERGKPGEFIKTAASYKMPALAITDHGNLYGAIEFYKNCVDSGVKPIIGCEIYVAPHSRFDKQAHNGNGTNYYHLVLLAINEVGYKNLMMLSSKGFLEGFYYKPRVDKELLNKHSEGLIAMSACLKGEIPQSLLKNDKVAAKKSLYEYLDIFGKDNFYLELMDNGIEDQRKVKADLIEMGKANNVKVVATNDCHFMKKDDSSAHDALLCIGTGKLLDDVNRMRFQTNEFYFRTPEEMAKLFSSVPEALTSTIEITEKCNLSIDFNQFYLPKFNTPDNESPDSLLSKLAFQGLEKRYGSIQPEHKNRLDYELDVIKKMDFSSYFLIVWDFINYAKKKGIPVGPGRGSGAGSLAAHCLGITDICPIEHGLLFERFLNPDRKTMPDLDIDFSDQGREEVIDYVKQKYGRENVAQIITFGALMARSVVRDVGRVMNIALNEVDRIAKLIPREVDMTISKALAVVPELKSIYKSDPRIKKLLDIGTRLEGLKRHTGVHAAGIVITKDIISSYTPLAKSSRDVVTTQYNDKSLISLGLLKVDFLGLSTLTVIDQASKEIQQRIDQKFDIEKIPMDDKKTYFVLSSGKTVGIFQLESEGMRDLLRKIKPTQLGDLVALISLYRPGPMGSGMLDEFVARKHKRVKVAYDHPLLKPILEDTFGVILYQEQVIRIAIDLGGFSPGKADSLRRAMSKKIPEELEQSRNSFVEGAKQKGIDKTLSNKIFEQMVYFSGYGFNKSHASVYALIAYRSAYLKAHFPEEFMCSLVTSEIGGNTSSTEKESRLVIYLREAESLGIPILKPDINLSKQVFAIEQHSNNVNSAAHRKHAIRFGLRAIKNVGEAAADAVIEERINNSDFKSFDDFCKRIDQSKVNKKVIESLIKVGAMDCFGEKSSMVRPKLLGSMEQILMQAQKIKNESSIGQGSLFKLEEISNGEIAEAESVQEWAEHDLLAVEKELLGLYLSGHPLAKFSHELMCYSQVPLSGLNDHVKAKGTNGSMRLAGIITNIRKLFTREKKEPYARFRIEDLDGELECILFPKNFSSNNVQHLKPNEVVVVKGRINKREESIEFLVDEIIPLKNAKKLLIQQVIISLSTVGLDELLLGQIRKTISQFPGSVKVIFHILNRNGETLVVETPERVEVNEKFQKAVNNILGKESWKIKV